MTASVPRQSRDAVESASPLHSVPSGGWVSALPGKASLRRAGRDWDAVRLDPTIGPTVYERMRDATHGEAGPVILDPYAGWHYWLVRPGATTHWDFPGVVCRSTGGWVTVVHAARTTGPGPHWLSPPHPDGRLAHAVLLHAVIRSVVGGA
ncbi:hypothetical protein ACFOSC_27775 [Streptantibioticus rubrisoli]|uniref:DNA primase/polymerase bifunctional N-terminal domain-containing protein n=1 Tax=Streptantibioticus rubrisoli TaxID=1387313 RepID=A0ABT1PK88_9ACTN|nr:hypothetical protein [Streptantibioticus rubrisoli]MCQ4045787.1 hypothetical protein [Streptantibioticus rubrisoli]